MIPTHAEMEDLICVTHFFSVKKQIYCTHKNVCPKHCTVAHSCTMTDHQLWRGKMFQFHIVCLKTIIYLPKIICRCNATVTTRMTEQSSTTVSGNR